MATGAYDVVLTAFNYSLLWQEAVHAVLPEAEKQHMGVVVGSPLQQGALSACFTEQVERGAPWLSPPRREQFKRLYALVEELDMPLPELAIRWVLSNPAVSTVLSGSRSVEEVEQNVGYVASGPLSAAVLDRVQEIADMVPFRPFEEPFGLPFTRVYRGPGMGAVDRNEPVALPVIRSIVHHTQDIPQVRGGRGVVVLRRNVIGLGLFQHELGRR